MQTYHFPACGCSIPIDETLPAVHDHPSLIYPDDINQLNLNCSATWDMLSTGSTKGVFQLESPLGRQWTKKLKPESIEHLSALGALLRPGCLRAKDEDGISMTEHYCLRKNGMEPIKYFHPALEPLLNQTYGVLTYQEQAMAIAVALAGFTPQEADDLRKAIGKKNTEVMAKVKAMFTEKAGTLGIVTPEEAAEIFGWIEKSQRYSFNKCISSDTIICRIHHCLFTVEEMYRIRNNIAFAKATGHESLRRKWKMLGHYGCGLSLCDDMKIRPNIIRDIQSAGINTVYMVTLENGATVRVTENHKFPTSQGDTPVKHLTKGCGLFVFSGRYPVKIVKIKSIIEDGQCVTYDVTMEAPNHTFVVNSGIITCNSHAVSYALIGYHTAHTKAHFPLQFYTSYLYHAKDKQDPLQEVRQLVNDAKRCGIEVLPPRFADLKYHFNTDGVIITFGLSDVKGVGINHATKIRHNAEVVAKEIGVPVMEWSWYDFLVYFSPTCNSSVVKRLIEVGATRNFRMDRQRQLAEYDAYNQLSEREQGIISRLKKGEYDIEGFMIREPIHVNNLIEALEVLLDTPKGVITPRREKVGSILKMLQNPPRPLVDTPEWIARTEEECLGIPITCNKIDGTPNLQANTTCQEYIDGKKSNPMIFAVDIQECREYRIQNGKNRGQTMAFLVIGDKTGYLEDVCIFSESWEKYGSLIYEGASVELRGKRDFRKGGLIVEEVWKI